MKIRAQILIEIVVAEALMFSAEIMHSAETPKLDGVFPIGGNVDTRITRVAFGIVAENGGGFRIPLALHYGERLETLAQRALDSSLMQINLLENQKYSIGLFANTDLGDAPFDVSHAYISTEFFSPVWNGSKWTIPEEFRTLKVTYASDFPYRVPGATEVRLYVRQGSKEEWFSSKTLGSPCELGVTEDYLKYGIIRIRAEYALPKDGREVSVMILEGDRWVFYGNNGYLQDYSNPPPSFLVRSGPSLKPPALGSDGTMTLTVMGAGERPVRIESTGDLRVWHPEEVSAVRQGKTSVPTGTQCVIPYVGGNRFFRVTLAEQSPQGN